MSTLFQAYLQHVHRTHASGAATDETSFYAALETLLDQAGEALDPEVHCVMELKDAGEGHPDGGLFLDHQPEADAPLSTMTATRSPCPSAAPSR